MIVQRLHEVASIVRTGQLVGPTPDYWSGSGLTNRTASSGLVVCRAAQEAGAQHP